MKYVKHTIRLTPEQDAALKAIKEREGQSVQWLVQRAVEQYLALRARGVA